MTISISLPGIQLAAWRAVAELTRNAFLDAIFFLKNHRDKSDEEKWLSQRNLLTLEFSAKARNSQAEDLVNALRSKKPEELVDIFEKYGKKLIRSGVKGQVSYYGVWNPTPIFPEGNSTLYESFRTIVVATKGPLEIDSVPSLIFLSQKLENDIRKAGGVGILTMSGEINSELSRVAAIICLAAERINNAYQSSKAAHVFKKIDFLRINFDEISPPDRNRILFAIFRTKLDISLHQLNWKESLEAIQGLEKVKPEFLGSGLEKYQKYWLCTSSVALAAVRQSVDGLPRLSDTRKMWTELVADDPDLARNPLATPAQIMFG